VESPNDGARQDGARQTPLRPTTFDRPGLLVAEVELPVDRGRDLADLVGDLVHAAAGHELRLRLRIELGGPTSSPRKWLPM
jgi:hypothetical protein